MFLTRPVREEPESTSLNTLNTSRAETEVIVIGSGVGPNNNSFAGPSSANLDGETSSILPNTVIGEDASILSPNVIDAVDEQKLLGNGTKRHHLQHKAPTACKLLKKTTSRNYWKKVPFSFIQVLIFGIILFVAIIFCMFWETFLSQFSVDFLEKGKAGLFISSPKSTNKLLYEPHSLKDRNYHEQLVKDVNTNSKATWKAVYNKFASKANDPQIVDKQSLRLTLTKNIESHDWSKTQMFADTEKQLKYLSELSNISLPLTFDSRFRWPECSSIHRVVNQGGCGSCWAMAATSVMSDRICIHSNGTLQPQISAQDLIECCPHCGGCRGTVWALFSFVHWKEHGIVTGDSYGSFEGCKPYEKSPSCGSPCSIDTYNSKQIGVYEVCWSVCQQLHEKSYNEDLYKAKEVYWVKPNQLNKVIYGKTMNQINQVLRKNKVDYETVIKREVLLNGPIIACFVVYDEFQHYKTGIYSSITSKHTHELYGHCAKLIGWGEENDIKYWIYMNTWGRSWGENGFFRVAISEIPEEAAAGIPLL